LRCPVPGTRGEAFLCAWIQQYIEIFHNRQRRHSRLGYLSPAVFAEAFKHLQIA
jgi:hypothetical protein